MTQSVTSPSSPTRDRILAALAEVVAQGDLAGFSVQQVADLAGVTHRTVYRYFPTRESMLEGLVQRVAESIDAAGGAAKVQHLADLPGAIRTNFAMFSEHQDLAAAAVRFSVGTGIENRDRQDRTHAVTNAVGELGLDARDARMVAGVLRHLSSSRTWLLLGDAGLGPDEAADVAAWAIEVLTAAVKDGNRPSAKEQP